MAHHGAAGMVAKSGAIGERDDCSKHRAVVGQEVQGADTEHRPQGKCIKRYPNIIGKDLGRADLVSVVEAFPPMDSIVDYRFAEERTDSRELRIVGIVPRAKKSNRSEDQKDTESSGRVAPGASKRLRKILGKEVADPPAALRVSPVNTAMSANYQTIEIVDQTRVARFRAGNRQVGCSPPVDAAQLAHFFAMQSPQRHSIEEIKQFLEPLPDGLAFIDKTINRHFRFPIANFRLPI